MTLAEKVAALPTCLLDDVIVGGCVGVEEQVDAPFEQHLTEPNAEAGEHP